MQTCHFRRSGVIIFLLLAVVILGFADISFGGFLAEDSTRFAMYWNLLESGEFKTAQDTLMNIGGNGHGCVEQMANFMLAWKASTSGDYGSVPVFVDLGVPADLSDYGLWMKADALNHIGQDLAAVPLWVKLADDSESVLSADAIYQLADHSYDKGQLDDCLDYAARYSTKRADADDKQHVEFLKAQTLALMGKHEEAVDAMWHAYSLAPLTGEAGRIRDTIDGYAHRFGYSPRRQSADEVALEYTAIEQNKQFALGLERAERDLKTIQPEQTEEVLRFFKGRFEDALSHRRDAVETLQDFLRRYPQSKFRSKAQYYLGRSAYLTDQDSQAIPALTEAGESADADIAGKAFDLLGTLQLDRHRPAEAVKSYRQWETLSKGTNSEQDCLWKLGRALWEAGRWKDAADTWKRLYELDEDGDYAPAALYWEARAEAKSGDRKTAAQDYAVLQSRFPYSYNAIIAPAKPDSVKIEENPLNCPSLDDLWEEGGAHCKKLAILNAMRISDFALRELPVAMKEMPEADGLPWWKAQHLLWQGKRMAAWRVILTDLGFYLRSAGPRPAAFTSLAYPLDFDPEIVRTAQQYGLDPYFVFGLICQESHFEEGIMSPAGAVGLMQLMPKTAYTESRNLGIGFARNKLRNADYNIQIGIAHLAHLFSDFHRDSVLVLAAYNAGPNAAQAWESEFGDHHDRDEFIENIPYRETRMYVKRNIEHAAAYRRLYPDVVSAAQETDKPKPLPTPPHKQRATYGVHKRRTH